MNKAVSGSKSTDEMPLFAKTQDFLLWLVPLTTHFPRIHRQTITRRLIDAALDFQEKILLANSQRQQARLESLVQADAALSRVRLYLRLVYRWKWINIGQYEHVSRMLSEMGSLLGGWQKQTKSVAISDRQSVSVVGAG